MSSLIQQLMSGNKVTIDTIAELDEFAVGFVSQLKSGAVVGLEGDLGTGKTAFVKSIAQALGISEVIKSPSFVFMYVYDIPNHPFLKKLVHVDAYRLNQDMIASHATQECQVLGLDQYLNQPDALVCIEWPRVFEHCVPINTIYISCEYGTLPTQRVFCLSDWGV